MKHNPTSIKRLFRDYSERITNNAVADKWQSRRFQKTAKILYNNKTLIIRKAAHRYAFEKSHNMASEEAYRASIQRFLSSTRIDDERLAANLRQEVLQTLKFQKAHEITVCHDTTHTQKFFANRKKPGYEKARIVYDNSNKREALGYTFASTAILGRTKYGKEIGLPYRLEIEEDKREIDYRSEPNIITDLILRSDAELKAQGLKNCLHVSDSAIDTASQLHRLNGVSVVWGESGRRKFITPENRKIYHDEFLGEAFGRYHNDILAWVETASLNESRSWNYLGIDIEIKKKIGCMTKKKARQKNKTTLQNTMFLVSYLCNYSDRLVGSRGNYSATYRAGILMDVKKLMTANDRWIRRKNRKDGLENGSQSRNFRISCTNDLSISLERLVSARPERWLVEETHRKLKWQRDSIGFDFRCLKIKHIKRMVFLSYAILAFINLLPVWFHDSEIARMIGGKYKYRLVLRYISNKKYPWYALVRYINSLE